MPNVSVIMAVHNGLPHLQTAVNSILNQTFQDFEFLIVDDASDDYSFSLLRAYKDPRVKLMRNSRRKGLSYSLNRALAFARGKYVARMDHDDISLLDRIEVQVAFLETNRGIDIVGSWVETIGIGAHLLWELPTEDEDIKCELMFNPSLVHSSVMFRKSVGLRYNQNIKQSQDYELWNRVSGRVTFANIDKVLIKYRIHQGQVGKKSGFKQAKIADKIRARILLQRGLRPSSVILKLHNDISRWRFSGKETDLMAINRWLTTVWESKLGKTELDKRALRKSLSKRWLASCLASIKLGLKTWNIFKANELSKSITFAQRTNLLAKCFFRQMGWRSE